MMSLFVHYGRVWTPATSRHAMCGVATVCGARNRCHTRGGKMNLHLCGRLCFGGAQPNACHFHAWLWRAVARKQTRPACTFLGFNAASTCIGDVVALECSHKETAHGVEGGMRTLFTCPPCLHIPTYIHDVSQLNNSFPLNFSF